MNITNLTKSGVQAIYENRFNHSSSLIFQILTIKKLGDEKYQ